MSWSGIQIVVTFLHIFTMVTWHISNKLNHCQRGWVGSRPFPSYLKPHFQCDRTYLTHQVSLWQRGFGILVGYWKWWILIKPSCQRSVYFWSFFGFTLVNENNSELNMTLVVLKNCYFLRFRTQMRFHAKGHIKKMYNAIVTLFFLI